MRLPKRYEYPLELLAGVAPQLLQGDDYDVAVVRAVELLNGCERVPKEKWRTETLAEMQRLEAERAENAQQVSFAAGVKEITGHKKGDRAEEWFIKYVRARIKAGSRSSPSLVGEELERELARQMQGYRTEGFTRREIDGGAWGLHLRDCYRRCRTSVSSNPLPGESARSEKKARRTVKRQKGT